MKNTITLSYNTIKSVMGRYEKTKIATFFDLLVLDGMLFQIKKEKEKESSDFNRFDIGNFEAFFNQSQDFNIFYKDEDNIFIQNFNQFLKIIEMNNDENPTDSMTVSLSSFYEFENRISRMEEQTKQLKNLLSLKDFTACTTKEGFIDFILFFHEEFESYSFH